MSRFVYICRRRAGSALSIESQLKLLADCISADNIQENSPWIKCSSWTNIAIFNPVNNVARKDTAIAFGTINSQLPESWHIPGTPIRACYHILARSDEKVAEFNNDILSSRTIWYVHLSSLFIASSSQRLIVSLLKSFEPNQEALTWFLSSGTPGPGISWDKRIHALKPDTCLTLHRESWRISMKSSPAVFGGSGLTRKECKESLYQLMHNSLEPFTKSPSDYVIPLSGGCDSRAIITLIASNTNTNVNTITWGTEHARKQPGTDAYIAEQVAAYFQSNHTYYPLDNSGQDFPVCLKRFVKLSEGRTDNISAYLDGFFVWKRLFENGVQAILRGDEALGSKQAVFNEYDARMSIGLILPVDYNKQTSTIFSELPAVTLPDEMMRKRSESIMNYWERIYQGFRVPTVLAALNETKAPYVEPLNPLINSPLVKLARGFPEQYRINKQLFKEVVREISPNIPFASTDAITSISVALGKPEIATYVKDNLSSEKTRTKFPPSLLKFAFNNYCITTGEKGQKTTELKQSFKKHLPGWMKSVIYQTFSRKQLHPNVLSLRILIAREIETVLEDDSKYLDIMEKKV